jgi:hypothetical protein
LNPSFTISSELKERKTSCYYLAGKRGRNMENFSRKLRLNWKFATKEREHGFLTDTQKNEIKTLEENRSKLLFEKKRNGRIKSQAI